MTITLLSQAPDVSELKVHHTQKDSALLVSPPLAGQQGPIFGEMIVAEDQVYFYSEQAQSGIAVEYPDIIIHAVSRLEGQPNIYCQLESGLFFPNQQLPEDPEEREETVTELRFIPRDTEALESIYLAMTDCAALHPDEEFMAEQQESEDEYYADPSDEAELNDVQQAALRHLESVFEQPKPQMNGVHKEEEKDEDKDMEE